MILRRFAFTVRYILQKDIPQGEEQICRTKVLYDLLCVPHDVINERKLLKPTSSVIVKLNFKALFIIFLLAGVNKFIIMQIMPATFLWVASNGFFHA